MVAETDTKNERTSIQVVPEVKAALVAGIRDHLAILVPPMCAVFPSDVQAQLVRSEGTTPSVTSPRDTTPSDTAPSDIAPRDTALSNIDTDIIVPNDNVTSDIATSKTALNDAFPGDTAPSDTIPSDTVPSDVQEGCQTAKEEQAGRLVEAVLDGGRHVITSFTNLLMKYELVEAAEILVKLMDPDNEEHTMKDVRVDSGVKPYSDVLQDSRGTLVDCLMVSPALLDLLQNHAVLNQDMANTITCRPNRPDKVRVLLDFMTKLGPQSLQAFIDTLHATGQSFLANILATKAFT